MAQLRAQTMVANRQQVHQQYLPGQTSRPVIRNLSTGMPGVNMNGPVTGQIFSTHRQSVGVDYPQTLANGQVGYIQPWRSMDTPQHVNVARYQMQRPDKERRAPGRSSIQDFQLTRQSNPQQMRMFQNLRFERGRTTASDRFTSAATTHPTTSNLSNVRPTTIAAGQYLPVSTPNLTRSRAPGHTVAAKSAQVSTSATSDLVTGHPSLHTTVAPVGRPLQYQAVAPNDQFRRQQVRPPVSHIPTVNLNVQSQQFRPSSAYVLSGSSPATHLAASVRSVPTTQAWQRRPSISASPKPVLTIPISSVSIPRLSAPASPKLLSNLPSTKVNKSQPLGSNQQEVEEWVTYRIDRRKNRHFKTAPPPQGTYKTNDGINQTDYSDPRDFHTPTANDQLHLWTALGPTRNSYYNITNVKLEKEDMRCLELGYSAVWNEIRRKLISWIFGKYGPDRVPIPCAETAKGEYVPSDEVPGYSTLATGVAQVVSIARGKTAAKFFQNGALIYDPDKHLFKLDRWYGLIEQYMFAPNWPGDRKRNKGGALVQNWDSYACEQCRESEVLCHGHREHVDRKCKPCEEIQRVCSKVERVEIPECGNSLTSEEALLRSKGKGVQSRVRPGAHIQRKPWQRIEKTKSISLMRHGPKPQGVWKKSHNSNSSLTGQKRS